MPRYLLLFFLIVPVLTQAQHNQIQMLAQAESVLSKGDTLNALNYFQNVLQIFPDSYPAALRLTEVNYQKGDYRQAIQYGYVTEDILERHLDSLQNSSSGLSEKKWMKERYTRDLSDIQGLKGKIRLKQDRPVDALHELNRALENNPSDKDIYLDLGLAYFSLNRMDDALHNFRRALVIDPASRGALFNLGNWYYHHNQPDSATYFYQKTIDEDPDFPFPYLYLADILTQTEDYDEALIQYNQFIERDSTFAEAFFKRGVILAENHEWQQAQADWNKVVTLEPDNSEAWRNLGLTLFRMEKYEKAIDAFGTSIDIKPDPYAFINRGYCYYMTGSNGKALEDYSRGLDSLQQYELGYYLRALAWKEAREKQKACKDLQKAWSLGYPKEETDKKLLRKCD